MRTVLHIPANFERLRPKNHPCSFSYVRDSAYGVTLLRAATWTSKKICLCVAQPPYCRLASPQLLAFLQWLLGGQSLGCLTFFWNDYWLRRAIRRGVLEGFLLKAAEEEACLGVTMDDDKVYVG